jgi:hypothetical protein
MGDEIHISRVAERFSSHTLSRSRPSAQRACEDAGAVRERLITAAVEVIAEGSDPRLGRSRVLL